ncbi:MULTISPECIES: transmembrane 220 family protein [Emticicia]|uniref:transmembrane 220 family protein n=1 Tax=Emticicia TaxID=312278 RepID=UPI0020A01E38|nr:MULTISPECIES: transmembrane 220 family protein [Emticicia]UTA69511.1 transmembrane 220 family protein [Emticicia sp. 21SJ11W-3]
MAKKILLWIFMAMFIYAAIVQYNDPDPYVWVPTYLIPVFLCYHKMKGKGEPIMFFTIGLLYLMWAINQFPPAWEGVVLNEMGMKTINIELARESLGLGICTLAMWVCALLKPEAQM